MNLRALEYVLAIAETGHFGRAAELCHVTQPTLSMQVAKLERELGAPLFERGKRSVRLTAVGRQVVGQAAEIRDRVRRIQELGRGATDALRGPFYLGVIPTIGPYLMPRMLPALREAAPGLELYLREEITQRLVERMQKGELDVAVLSLPLDEAWIEYESVYTEEFVAALPTGHALSKRKRLKLSDLDGENILLLEEGNCMRDQTASLCKGSRPAAQGEYRASSIECLRQMVGAGMGCTFLPRTSTEGGFSGTAPLCVARFAKPSPSREIVLAWRRSHPSASAFSGLAGTVREALARPLD